MKIKLITFFVLLVILFHCAVTPPPVEERPPIIPEKMPEVRIGMSEKLDFLNFESNGKIEIFQDAKPIAQTVLWNKKWRVEIRNAQPANITYRLQYKEFDTEFEARQIRDKYFALGLPVIVEQFKKRKFQDGEIKFVNTFPVLLKPEFETADQAYQYQWTIRDKITAVALPFIKTPQQGEVVLKNVESGKSISQNLRMVIRGDQFTIKLPAAEGFHFESELVRTYRNQIEFIIDRFGKLTIVNVLPIETYLMGVVGSEMQEKFPLESLKAQAVTARGYTLARIGKQHRLSPFDLCDEVHCHVYGGIDRESPKVTKAVMETSGRVLLYKDKICDTFYAGVCGGHTENNENVWEGEPQAYLTGKLDAKLNNLPDGFLQNEENVRLWIENKPEVFCNTQDKDVPDYLEYTKKYFRWQVRYTQSELSQIIRQKTGQNIGTLIEIIPVLRGVSGRLVEVKLHGTNKTISIEKELEIRKALSENYLYSACFVVDRDRSDFILKGAGWGHGVGMCQTGAAMMALKDYNYQQILKHYYSAADIVKLY